jgi:hypothetical protein
VGRLQGTLEGWVHQHGAWPWAVGILGVLLAGLATTWRGRRNARNRQVAKVSNPSTFQVEGSARP